MDIVKQAILLAQELFKDKTDKQNQPYILHLFRVMFAMPQQNKELQCIAILHDIIEDTHVSADELRALGFPDSVVEVVKILTKPDGQDYQVYIHVVSQNANARTVKLADLRDNMDITRLNLITDRDVARLRKYHKAYRYLTQNQ